MQKYNSMNRIFIFMLAVIVSVMIVGLSTNTVSAATVTVNGTVGDTSPLWPQNNTFRVSAITPFTVSVTGIYDIQNVVVPQFDYGAWARISDQADSTYGNVVDMVYRGDDGFDTGPVTLVAGVIYYTYMVNDVAYPINGAYSYEITGVGDICLNSATCGGGGTTPINPVNPGNPTNPTIPGSSISSIPSIALPPAVAPDDRLNWQFGDLSVVLYEHNEGGVVAYCYNADTSESSVAFFVNQEMMDTMGTTSQNDPITSYNENGCRTTFHVLGSGEYQITIWSIEGKVYEILADNINFADATLRYFDPNE